MLMDFQKAEPGGDDLETSLDHAFAATGLPVGLSEALADPIVKVLMAADGVDPKGLEELLRRTAARLALRDQTDSSSRTTQCQRAVKPAASTAFGLSAKGFALAIAVIAGLSVAPRPVAADEAPVAFVRALGDQAVSVIRRPDMPLTTKAAYFGQMVRQDFDVTGICRFVLGPYWRGASPKEQQQFCDGFADRLVRFYGQRLAQSGNEEFLVTGSRIGSDGVIVTSRIIPPRGAPIAVDWRLGVSDGVYKIEDVAIDGVSMALAQRSEIAALIAREGGQVGVVLAKMRAGGWAEVRR
jgi:phospholipid transport system substrate-binding protein